MKFTLDNPSADYVFGNYGDGKLKVNQSSYDASLIIFPDKLHTDWPVTSVDDLEVHHFEEIITRHPGAVESGSHGYRRCLQNLQPAGGGRSRCCSCSNRFLTRTKKRDLVGRKYVSELQQYVQLLKRIGCDKP